LFFLEHVLVGCGLHRRPHGLRTHLRLSHNCRQATLRLLSQTAIARHNIVWNWRPD
jgi:hypothetical protein